MNKPIVITVSAKAQHGKDSFANAFEKIAKEQGYRVLIIHYGDILKYVCKQYFGWNGVKDKAGRDMLQHVGTELVRFNNSDAWANCVVELVKGLQTEYDFVLVPDTRFPNEIECWENTDFFIFTVKILRKNEDGTDFDNGLTSEQKQHLSEVSLDDYHFNYEVESANLESLALSAESILEDILNMDVEE